MRVAGVVAEYDPFHRGHAYHLAQTRQRTQADYIVVVMSGCFTQRGQGAIVSPAARARMALANGADAVLELPVPWAVREAEHFALGAVSILHRLGCVTHIAFGAETNDLAALTACAKLLEHPTDELNIQVQAGLRAGLSHPSALSQALAAQCPVSGLEQPNNVLALCYLRALLRLNSNIAPILIHRNSSYHATDLSEPFPSATAVRGAVRRGAWAQVREAMPASAYAVLQAAARHGAIYDLQRLDTVLLHLLRTTSPEALRQLPGCVEGLENRLQSAAQTVRTREELLAAVKTKRYPYARLSRLCTALMLDFTPEIVSPQALPPYARLLGFRRDALPLLRCMKEGSLPLVEKAADGPRESPFFQADARAYDLWCLGAQQPAGLMWRQQIVIR